MIRNLSEVIKTMSTWHLENPIVQTIQPQASSEGEVMKYTGTGRALQTTRVRFRHFKQIRHGDNSPKKKRREE